MLTAIAKGKAGRISVPGNADNISWREVFRRSEDLLTAVFFGRLRYLSDTGVGRVLGLLVGREAADGLGTLEDVEFWPHLTGLKDRSWVEPDVLLHFQKGLVLIEVKPPFGGSQSLEQWKAEVHALVAESRNGERTLPGIVHFLALGRNGRLADVHDADDFDTWGCFDLFIHTREWEAILAAIPDWASECSRADKAIFEDWMRAFELFGLHQDISRSWRELLVWDAPLLSLTPLSWWTKDGMNATEQDAPAHANQTEPWFSLLQYVRNNSLELDTWT